MEVEIEMEENRTIQPTDRVQVARQGKGKWDVERDRDRDRNRGRQEQRM